MIPRIKIYAQRQAWRDSIEFQLAIEHTNGEVDIAQPVTFHRIDPGELYNGPALTLQMTDAQRLMDELWNCGLRPSEGSGSAGSLAATERHLKDMQCITTGLLKKIGVSP